ncbi:MAG: prepilin-type N-terminal cleavage/methylation domain-containing protein [Candidatus Izemoplasmataceae bacterium]
MIKNNKGVTLVELLIVIVILGIIAAISIPAVGGIVENSRKDAVLADATTVRNAANLYCVSEECLVGQILTADELSAYISGFEGTYQVEVGSRATNTYRVAILSGDYGFVGNPLGDVNRGWVVAATSVTLETGDPLADFPEDTDPS